MQEYDSQQLALQTLITQQQEMMQELTTAASGHMSADAMALMLQEVSYDGSQSCASALSWPHSGMYRCCATRIHYSCTNV